MATEFVSYAIQYSPEAKSKRRTLPRETQLVLFDVLDKLTEDPNAFPGRTQSMGRDGSVRIYKHPNPALEITFEVIEENRVLRLHHLVVPKVQVTKPVFISYSHEDVKWLEKVKIFLAPLERADLVKVWDDREIQPGAPWLEEIRQSLESARVAVLLISQNFWHSVFIQETELPQLLKKAQERECRVFWIAISSSTVEASELSKYQAANDPKRPLDMLPESEQNQVLVKLFEQMKDVVQVH